MSKHLADHHSGASSGRLARYLRIAHEQSRNVWARLWQTRPAATGGRRVVEFVRIARQKRD